MKRTGKFSAITTFALFLLFGFISCSDNPASVDPDDAPTSPSMEHVELDFSTFDQSQFFSMEEETLSTLNSDEVLTQGNTSAYNTAASFAWFADHYFTTMAALPQTYFQEDRWGEPTLEGDTWVWSFNLSHEGESLEMKTTAEEIGSETHWELRYSYSTSEESVEDALLIAAQMNHNGEEGSWQMYNFDENEEIFDITYQMDGDVTTKVDMDISDDDDARILYQHDGTISSLEIWDSGEHTHMEWDSESGTGFIESPQYEDGERICWDESFQDTEC